MLPQIEIMVSELQIDFLYFENQNLEDVFNLRKLFGRYNDGFYGILTEMLGKSKSFYELEDQMKEFIQLLLENLKYEEANYKKNIDFDSLVTAKKQLTELAEDKLEIIIQNIERIFNNPWKDKKIEVYLVPDTLISTGKSNPLLIPVSSTNNNMEMEQILVHELIHRNAAGSHSSSLYAMMEKKGKELGISGSEIYNRILHPLFFYVSWAEIRNLDSLKQDIEPFYNNIGMTKTKFFINTIRMLSKTWDNYMKGEYTCSEFVEAFMELYISNQDRKLYKGVIK